jgi:WD repeat-containing protein 19
MLTHLGKQQRAFSIVRETKSSQGGLLVAKHCQAAGDHRAAVEFLLLAKCPEDAFKVATEHEQMEAFTAALGKEGSADEYRRVAQYYEERADPQRAGQFWFLCKDYTKALRLFLKCGEKAVNQAIEVVGRARSDMLTHTLIDFLMGEADGVPKDPNYIFRLYMALGNYPQAAKTAIIIARQEQELGNYRVAHQILFDTHRELTSQRIRVPQELTHSLMLLHSYIIVKPLSKMKDYNAAARMLIRVARSISKFPVHVVPILTSAVIECHRAGLRGASFEYATTLMRQEYRAQLQDPYKRKIEAIVRKPGDKTDEPEVETASPFDMGARLPETALECPSTKNQIPYCVASGRHVVLSDMCLCPSCGFPALFSCFTRLLESDGQCPMCVQQVPLAGVVRMDEGDAKAWLDKQMALGQKKPPPS